MRETAIVTAARRLRPLFDVLMGQESAAALTVELETLLDRANSGESVDDAIVAALTEHAELREALAQLLRSSDDDERSGFAPLPGLDEPSELEIYCCTTEGCDYSYPIFETGEVPGVCPRHGLGLHLREG